MCVLCVCVCVYVSIRIYFCMRYWVLAWIPPNLGAWKGYPLAFYFPFHGSWVADTPDHTVQAKKSCILNLQQPISSHLSQWNHMNPSYFAAVSHRNHMKPPYFVDVSLAIGHRRGLRIYTKSQPFPHLSVEGHGTHSAVVSLGVHQVTHSHTDYLYIYICICIQLYRIYRYINTHTQMYTYIYIIYIYMLPAVVYTWIAACSCPFFDLYVLVLLTQPHHGVTAVLRLTSTETHCLSQPWSRWSSHSRCRVHPRNLCKGIPNLKISRWARAY